MVDLLELLLYSARSWARNLMVNDNDTVLTGWCNIWNMRFSIHEIHKQKNFAKCDVAHGSKFFPKRKDRYQSNNYGNHSVF
jgi:hypothetical protein